MHLCPCGSRLSYQTCCEPYLTSQAIPATPEQLMRSRYTAYTKADIDYIEKTMQAPANTAFDAREALEWAKAVTWQKLEVLGASATAESGEVEFIATYAHANKKFVLHEISQFRHDAGRWFYIDGYTPEKNPVTRDTPKLSRNDPCLCGSQKKYKKCCGS